MICFEVEGRTYAVESAKLAGVATACPFVSYPGLPKGVCGIVQWSGRIFPVLDRFCGPSPDPKSCTFLFSADEIGGPYREVAVAVPGTGNVRVLVAGEEGAESFEEIDLAALSRHEAPKKRGGKKVAA